MNEINQPFEREQELALEIETLLLRMNPMGISHCRDNEYSPEARAIAPLLPNCQSEGDVITAVHQVFVRFFTAPYDAGLLSRYAKVGHEIWELWLKYKGEKPQEESPQITALRQRASTGNPEALLELGCALCNGDGVLRNIKEGHACVERAASQGFVGAQLTLGRMYEDGFVAGGWQKAKEWYEKAAAQGNKVGQYYLGVLYSRPFLNSNFAAASEWLEKAALQGLAPAQRDLGMMYSRGDGVPKNIAKAREWLEKSAAQGNEQAQRVLRELPKQTESADTQTAQIPTTEDIFKAVEVGQTDFIKNLARKNHSLAGVALHTGHTLLHAAALHNRVEIVPILIQAGVPINQIESLSGQTALHLAVVKNRAAIVKTLLEAGADVNARNKCQFTPLHDAAYDGNIPMIEILLSFRADLNAIEMNGCTPTAMAMMQGHEQAANFLRNSGGQSNIVAGEGILITLNDESSPSDKQPRQADIVVRCNAPRASIDAALAEFSQNDRSPVHLEVTEPGSDGLTAVKVVVLFQDTMEPPEIYESLKYRLKKHGATDFH